MRLAIILGAVATVSASTLREDTPSATARLLAGAYHEARALVTSGDQLTETERLHHVAHRLSFGPRPGQIDAMRRMGIDRWIEQQLDPERIRDTPGDELSAAYHHLHKTPAQLAQEFPPPNVLLRAAQRGGQVDSAALRREARERRTLDRELMSARLARAVVSERQLNEVMVDFWLNHFSVFIGKNQRMRYALPAYEYTAIRPHVLGNFRELLGSVAHSSAMLIYLDNAQSVADSGQQTTGRAVSAAQRRRIEQRMSEEQRQRATELAARRPKGLNENYARELLELHTLGVDGGYTQQDVIDVARALTGWTVVPPNAAAQRTMQSGGARLRRAAPQLVVDGDFLFNPATHDAGAKQVLGVKLKAGRGMEDGEHVLDILAAHPATARHIARKLTVRFISDDPPASIIDRAADTFTRTQGDIRAVVRTIVTSPEFYERAAYRAKVKSPFELIVSSVRALGGSADTTMLTAAVATRLGQPIYGRQTPDGWPETGGEWMNTGAILTRINLGMFVAAGRLPGARITTVPELAALQTARASREAQIDGVVDALLGGSVSNETREVLLTGENPMLGKSETPAQEPMMRRGQQAGDRRPLGAQLQLGANRSLTPLEQLVGLALGSPEFQRR